VDTDAEGGKRDWGWGTIAFDGRDGRVAAVLLQRLQWIKRSDGSWEKRCINAHLRRLPVQLVLLAIGFSHPVHRGLIEQMQLGLDARGNVSASDKDYQTTVNGVFACGDMRRGQSLVVWAIREGRQCARAVDIYLSGTSELPRV
jgi:glutamate synthase (NADPH/NADH) small chain